jgi:hypothetical protein
MRGGEFNLFVHKLDLAGEMQPHVWSAAIRAK